MMMRDNASNGVKACNDWGVRNFGCIGHSIHLVIGPFIIKTRKKRGKKIILKIIVQMVLMVKMILKKKMMLQSIALLILRLTKQQVRS